MIPKFRLYTEKDKMQKVTCLVWNAKGDIYTCYHKGINSPTRVKNPILMQSTGLKDKNGVEIFEGDILTDEGSFGFDFWDYGEVVFDKDEYTYLIEWKSENVCESIINCGDYSIASNIYENKELLEN